MPIRKAGRRAPNCARSGSSRSATGSASASKSALRDSLNPTGEPTMPRYTLAHDPLLLAAAISAFSRRAPQPWAGSTCIAPAILIDNRTGSNVLTNTLHEQNSFQLNPNQYSTVVGEDDAQIRTVAELSQEIVRAAQPVPGASRRRQPAAREAGPCREDRPGARRRLSAAARPRNPRGPALRPGRGPGARARRRCRPYRLRGFERPVPRRRAERRRARRRSGAAGRRGGAAEPRRRPPGGAGARRGGWAGAALCRVSRRHAGRGAGRRRGRRAVGRRRRCGGRSRARRARRRSAASRTRRATAPR